MALKYTHASSAKKPAEGSAAEEHAETPAEAKAEGDKPGAAHGDERKTMFKRHEVERRDMHGSHRDQHRQMTTRHEKEISEMLGRHADAAGEGEPAPKAEA